MDFDDEILETALHRKDALEFLTEGPRSRRSIQEALDVSKATRHRILRTFEDEGLLRRSGDAYELTEYGRVVGDAVGAFDATVRTAQRIRPLLEAFGEADLAYDLDHFADVTVTSAHPDDPTRPVHRYLELFEGTSLVRTVARTSFVPPLYLEEIFDRFFEDDDKRGVVVYPKTAVENRYADYPDIHRKVAREDQPLRYRVYDRAPFGLTIYDRDHVGLRAYDRETNTLLLFADTDDPEAVAWAEDVFERYYDESKPLSAFETFPDWAPTTAIYEDIV